ncbi:MAG: hypothetical protein KJ720_04980 [Proteobacteria bacterium]|nr:hypothetical protein [Pseudomonadota bacterium]MBU1450818.1 hypothetical protein [Pseudomonadota bacterium]MBU2468798.1 hypothetical protein [Pseudomonadota bacterium]MBU2516850.1 hypothetical protein [Pseudomonadota bacterium]
MEPSDVDELRSRLRALREQTRELQQAAGDFPALVCNTARIQASLTMIAMDLGMTQEGQGEC